jgi:nucleoside-triphosphate--adenylate kinase
LTLVVNLDVPDAVILSRIADRWTHLPSGRVYNTRYNRPRVAGRDDLTGELLVRRADDNQVGHPSLPAPSQTFTRTQETFVRRLASFYASTSGSAPLCTLAGETSDEIWPQLEMVVRREYPTVRERTARRRDGVGEVG